MALTQEQAIYTAIITTLTEGMTARAVAGVAAKQAYQPRMVGAPTGMAMLLSNLGIHRYGFLGRRDAWDEDNTKMVHTETQNMESKVQLMGWSPAPPPPKDLPPYTAGDLARLGAAILSSDAGRERLRVLGFGIERVTDVREPFGKDEKDQFISESSFDFVLAYRDTEVMESPVLMAYAFEIYRV